jgi:hypothetical protein
VKLRTIAGLAWLVVAHACQNIEPERTAGMRFENVSRLKLGLDRSTVVMIMGEPLPRLGSIDHPGREMLTYARPGARWILGEYRSNVRGYECLVGLEEGKVVSARVLNAASGAMCYCSSAQCAADWAAKCFPERREQP